MRYPAADVDAARILKALAHPARLALLRTLGERRCCCADLVRGLPLAQSTVSEHLRVLKDCGLVGGAVGEGRRAAYVLDAASVAAAAAVLADLAAGLAEAEARAALAGGPGCETEDRPQDRTLAAATGGCCGGEENVI